MQALRSLTTLPADVLEHIFEYLSVRARLLVLTRVSKRLRNIVYLSIRDNFPLETGRYRIATPYHLFPNLTSLSCYTSADLASVGTQLRSLRVCQEHGYAVFWQKPSPLDLSMFRSFSLLTGLTSLDWRTYRASPANLMQYCGSSLTHLSLPTLPRESKLRSLTSLRSIVRTEYVLRHFERIAWMVSSLTELSVLMPTESVRALAQTTPPPLLSKLIIAVPRGKTTRKHLAEWIIALPSLSALGIILRNAASSNSRSLRKIVRRTTCLTSLDFLSPPVSDNLERLLDALVKHTNLRTLEGFPAAIVVRDLCKQLTTLRPRYESASAEKVPIALCTSLRQLVTTWKTLRDGMTSLTMWRLPHLQTLTVCAPQMNNDVPFRDAVGMLSLVLERFPSLYKIELTLSLLNRCSAPSFEGGVELLKRLLERLHRERRPIHLRLVQFTREQAQALKETGAGYPWIEMTID